MHRGVRCSSRINRHMHLQVNDRGDTHESTWFSKERMTGKWEVLKAHSAMASITSWKTSNITQHHLQESTSKAKCSTLKKQMWKHVSVNKHQRSLKPPKFHESYINVVDPHDCSVFPHLKGDFWCHGEPVCDDRFLLCGTPFPNI